MGEHQYTIVATDEIPSVDIMGEYQYTIVATDEIPSVDRSWQRKSQVQAILADVPDERGKALAVKAFGVNKQGEPRTAKQFAAAVRARMSAYPDLRVVQRGDTVFLYQDVPF